MGSRCTRSFVTFFPEKSNQKPRHAKNFLLVRFIFILSVRPSAYSVVAHPPFSSYGQKKEAFCSVEQFSVTCFYPYSK